MRGRILLFMLLELRYSRNRMQGKFIGCGYRSIEDSQWRESMSTNDVLPLGAVLASEILSAFGLPGGSSLQHLATNYIEKRRQEAREILFNEISRGDILFDAEDVDPLVGILLRYSKSCEEGAARNNLNLMAKIIVGLKKQKALSQDKFNRWAATLAHLTRDELMIIGKAYRIALVNSKLSDGSNTEFWELLNTEMKLAKYEKEEITALATSVSRYGLLSPAAAWSDMHYHPTKWLIELGSLASMDTA